MIQEDPVNGEKEEPKTWFASSRFVKWFSWFDENYMSPFFIRNYDFYMTQMSDNMHTFMQKNFDSTDPEEMLMMIE